MTNTTMRSKAVSLLLLEGVLAGHVFAQCEGKAGFARSACEIQQGAVAPGSPAARANAALSTGFADTIHTDILPASVAPQSFTPLTKLARADDGSFILVGGIFEAYVQSYSLDPGDRFGARPAGYYPAPIKGTRAKAVADILKQAELHPDVTQGDIQALLYMIVGGSDLEAMPPQIQQTAARVMSKEGLKQIQGAIAAQAFQKSLLNMLKERMAKDPRLQAQIAKNNAKQKELDQKFGISEGLKAMQAAGVAAQPLSAAAEIVVLGTWTQMPGDFYLRYLPEGSGRIRVQLLVPDEAISDTPLLFDPTQYLAVYSQAPAQRLGVTMRPAR
jgi:hypothetical protein